MARVPYSPVPEVRAEPVRPKYFEIPTNPGQFGGLVAGAEERAGQQASESSAETFRTAVQLQQMRNATDALDRSTAASQDLGALDAQFRQLSGQNAVNALQEYQSKVRAIQDQYSEGLSPMGEMAFKRDFRIYADRTLMNMGLHAGDQQKQAYVTGLRANIAAEQSRLVRDTVTGETPDFSQLHDRTLMLAQAEGLDQASATALIQANTGKAMHDMVIARIAKGDIAGADAMFQKALKENAPGTNLPILDGDHVASLTRQIEYSKMLAQHKAEVAQGKAAAVARVGLDREMATATAIVGNGQSAETALAGLTDKRIEAAYPADRYPGVADEVKERVNDLRQTSVFLAQIAGKSPEQLRSMITGLPQPDPNDPATYQLRTREQRALTMALDRTSKALAADPAGYVLAHNPADAAMLQGAMKDPKQFGAYAVTVLGAQRQMGVPEAEQHVLPVQAAKTLAARIMANPETAPALMGSLEKQLGPTWHNVWRDVTQLGKLPAAYQAVGAIGDGRQASLLARALAEPSKKPGETVADLVPDSARKGATSVDQIIKSDPTWTQFQASLMRQPGMTAAARDNILGAARTLAYANMVYGGAPDAETAAAAAVKAFTEGYSFDLPGGPRVPAAHAAAVSANARALLASLGADRVAIPALYGKPGQPAPDEYLDLLKAAPTWVTAPNEDALWLVDNGGRIVRDKAGAPLAVPFSAPMPAGATAPAGETPDAAASAEMPIPLQ
jgi:hypothetical protein